MNRKCGHPPISCHSANNRLPRCPIVSLPFSRAAAFLRWRLSPWRHMLWWEPLVRLCHDDVWASAVHRCGWWLLTLSYVGFFNIANNCNKDPPSQPTDAPFPARNYRMISPSTDYKTLNDLNIILLNIPYSFMYFFTFRWVLPLECRILTLLTGVLLCPVALTNAQLP